MHFLECPKMHVTQNALRAQIGMWSYWKRHFLTGRKPKLKKHMFARPPARPLADRAGRQLGRLCFILESINKVRLLGGDFQSSLTLSKDPKLTKSHVRRPVSRYGSGYTPVIMALGCVNVPTNSVHMVR